MAGAPGPGGDAPGGDGPVWQGLLARPAGDHLELVDPGTDEPVISCGLVLRVAGEPVPVTSRSWRVEPDELELTTTGAGLGWSVRHAFAGSWHTRITVQPSSISAPVVLEWQVRAPAVWSWPAGPDGLLAVLGPEADVLLTRPQRGVMLPSEEPGSVELGRFEVGPQDHPLVTLRTRPESRAEIAAGLPAWVPTLEREVGDPVELTHPDAALVLPDGLTLWTEEPLSLVAPEPAAAGAWQLRLHGPAGETRLGVCWAERPEQVVRERAGQILAQTTRRQGVPVLARPLSALLVGRGGVGPEAEEAVARVLDAGGGTTGTAATTGTDDAAGRGEAPWLVLLAVEEHQRHGAPEQLQRAAELLAGLALVPAAPTAAMAVLVAAATSGADPSAAARVLAGWSTGTPALLHLELQVLAGRLDPQALQTAGEIVDRLGAGLPGEPLHQPDPVRLAREVTLLRWLPDAAAEQLGGRLLPGTALAELVQRTERRLLARADLAEEALAWLTTTVLER